MKMGSPMILTCMNRMQKKPKYEIKHIYRYEGNTDPGDEVYGGNPNQEKRGLRRRFCKFSDAAQVLIISVLKTE
jgi:hypothetical protein